MLHYLVLFELVEVTQIDEESLGSLESSFEADSLSFSSYSLVLRYATK